MTPGVCQAGLTHSEHMPDASSGGMRGRPASRGATMAGTVVVVSMTP
jgi:hypothetical protein